MRTLVFAAALVASLAASAVPASAQMGMDARSMSGIPLPLDDVPDGTVVVRLVRVELSNVVAGHAVELRVGAESRTARTDESGRATFAGLTAGTRVKAMATLDGEGLASQEFAVPARGGVRLLLVASGAPGKSGEGVAPAAPGGAAVPGSVELGGQSRVIIEFEDDVLEVFCLLDLVNDATTPVLPSGPLTLDLPAGAASVTLLEGSSPQAEVRGLQVVISGPFQPGSTVVQVAYRLPADASRMTIEHVFPVRFRQPALMVQRVGTVRASSPQVTGIREMTSDGGRLYVAGVGPALAPSTPFVVHLEDVPARSTWPRTLALAIAFIVLGAGAYGAFRGGGDARGGASRAALEARRERAFQELVRVERRARAGELDARARARRDDLMDQLERIYGELDTEGQRGDEGHAR